MNEIAYYLEQLAKEDSMEVDLARCYICGFEGEYRVEVVETDYYDPISKIDTTRPMCKDLEACNRRFIEAIKCKEES